MFDMDTSENVSEVTDSNDAGNNDSLAPKECRALLPCPPQQPDDGDCCGSGCVPCVFDIYEQDLKIWKQECRKIQEHQKSQEIQYDGNLLSELEYRKFSITEVKEETKNCFRYRLELPEFTSLGLKVGQHIIIRETHHGTAVSRQYTPISDINCMGHFLLIIKYRKLLLLAAGTGIAPMSQVIQSILGNEEDDTIMQLFYACKSYDQILMKSELNEWSSFWNFSATYVLSQETSNKASYRYGDLVVKGRMDLEFLTKNVLPMDINPETFVLICGTKSFENDMIECCKLLNFKDTQIHRF
ncbi:NADH-cytochrome b5 reductase-like isoform X2 [Ostrea edulis]|uniref:NADH-cytochrome b5 reductase-like isoform X2 n=1 Tax=Ostrea edulis TaxID=37623 RepID=UPI0024AEB43C|nr:NADH-cytochrome b5 reductase-like isoform X2 [Ostrea edulis]